MSENLFDPQWRGKNRLYGYYISFGETGAPVIDNVLAAIADAGKAYHNTRDWNDAPYDRTESCTDSIQRMAEVAAEKIDELKRDNMRLRRALANRK